MLIPFLCFEELFHAGAFSSYVLKCGIANACKGNSSPVFVHRWGEIDLKLVKNTPETKKLISKETFWKHSFLKKFILG